MGDLSELSYLCKVSKRNNLIKEAGGDIVGSLKSLYSHVKENPVSTATDLLSESFVMSMLRTFFGNSIYAIIAENVLSFFGIKLPEILSSMISGILGLSPSKDNQTTSDAIENVVSSVVDRFFKTSNDKNNNIVKNANAFSLLSKNTFTKFFKSFFTQFFSHLLLGAGFLLARGAVQKGMEAAGLKPSSTTHQFKPSTQTKFKVKPGFSDNKNKFIYNAQNDSDSISSLILSFVHEIYDGLEGQDSLIKSTEGFKLVVDIIEEYNLRARGANIVIFPPELSSKKTTVDVFIDEVASKAK